MTEMVPTYSRDSITLYLGDCLVAMKSIADQSIDLILCDLPYGTTYCKWDAVIPFDDLWDHYKRIITPNGAIVLTACQPFSSALVMSNPKMFRCEWIWDKKNPTNFANANRQPLKQHESVLVFGKGQTTYNPQKVPGKPNHIQGKRGRDRTAETMNADPSHAKDDLSGMKFPKTIIEFPKHSSQCGLHPTQKPVALMEYLIKTYSNEGDLVLDNCMGSGTTGVACQNLSRRFIGIEKDETYFATARSRMFPDH